MLGLVQLAYNELPFLHFDVFTVIYSKLKLLTGFLQYNVKTVFYSKNP